MRLPLPSPTALGRRLLAGVLLLGMMSVAGCAKRPVERGPALMFPAPPERARIQYLGSISSQDDLPPVRSGFADFVLGPPASNYPLAKPIAATLRGSRLYVCDTVVNSVLVYDLESGDVHLLRGNRGAGKIKQPNNLDFDAEGRLYIADRDRQAVLVYDAEENFVTALGHPGECKPVAVAVSGDELVVCDRDEHEIEVWNKADGAVKRRFGGLGGEAGQFLIPTQVAVDDAGHVYVTDTGNFRVQKLTLDGQHVATYGGMGRGLGQFAWPKGLDVDSRGRLYVGDSRFANIQIFDDQGRLLLFFGGPGPDGGNLDLPAGVRVVPWAEVRWLRERLEAGFDPESLVIVVSQQGQGFINLFAVARDTDAAP